MMMKRSAHHLVHLFAAASLLAAQQYDVHAGQDQTPLFKAASSELVVVPVTVTDKQGRLISDLEREHFTVFDNGRPQEIAVFNREDTPVSIALVIDDSGSMRQRLGQVIASALAFARGSHPEDELFVIEFNERVRDALDGRSITAADAAELETALSTLRPEGQTALYNALVDGLGHLEHAAHSRRVMVLVSDGGDNASSATIDDVMNRARRSEVTIYTIGLFDENARDADPGVLKRLSETTGGQRFLPSSPGVLMRACEQIAREIRNSYTLGYAPQQRDGGYHQLRVKVTAPSKNVVVRTRPGYFAAQAATASSLP
jgi:Ca-activated chloride channel family protein